jgi:hypothetical protein
MNVLIFLVGCTIFSLYVTFFLFSFTEKEDKKEVIKIDDYVDYDGHGNWGRFPPKKRSLKEGRLKKIKNK